jgi:hypothetical protein
MIHDDMSNVTPFPRPIHWDNLRADEAERLIQKRCQSDDTDSVIYTNHTWDRVSERDITRADIVRILRNGHCDQPKRNERGKWQVIVSMRLKGSREAGVVTVILEKEEKLVVRTVEWIDVK